MKPLLQVKQMNIAYHILGEEILAVQDIDFLLHEGETLGIVGESGCGKSTIARALARLLPPCGCTFTGQVIFDERNLETFSEKQMRVIRGKEIAIIFQDQATALNPTQRVGIQIIEGFLQRFKTAARQEAMASARQLLHKLGFLSPEEVMSAYPHTLSGGMRQRVLIAIALIREPKILLADEMTSSLDEPLQVQVLDLLKEMQQTRKMSILLMTHDLKIASRFCDRILVMYAGKFIEAGSAGQIFRNPQHPYTQMLINSMPRLDTSKERPLAAIAGSPHKPGGVFHYCAFCPRCPSAMNICAESSPQFFQISETHWCACFKHKDQRFGG